jgi:hypothetical protein
MGKLKFLFDVTKTQENSTMIFSFTRKFGEFKDGSFYCDFDKLKSNNLDGFIKIANKSNTTNYVFCCGTELCLTVNKRYAWDKEEVICNQKVNYTCARGYIFSVLVFIKAWIFIKANQLV